MTDKTKKITKKTYIWSHVAVILFHVLIGILLVLTYYRDKIGSFNSKTLVLVLGLILIFMSLGGLVPILKDYDQIVIE